MEFLQYIGIFLWFPGCITAKNTEQKVFSRKSTANKRLLLDFKT